MFACGIVAYNVNSPWAMYSEKHPKLLVFSVGVYCYNTFILSKRLNAFYLDIYSLEVLSSMVTQYAKMFMSSLLDIKYCKCYLISIL